MNTLQRMNVLEAAIQQLLSDHPEFQEEGTTGNDLLVGLQYLADEATDEWKHDSSC